MTNEVADNTPVLNIIISTPIIRITDPNTAPPAIAPHRPTPLPPDIQLLSSRNNTAFSVVDVCAVHALYVAQLRRAD